MLTEFDKAEITKKETKFNTPNFISGDLGQDFKELVNSVSTLSVNLNETIRVVKSSDNQISAIMMVISGIDEAIQELDKRISALEK